jgi:hypothetical protein
MFLFITKKNATLFQTRCLYEVRALQMRNGLYQYTLLCKRLLLCKQKKKIPARSLGEKSAHREKLFFFLLSNSTKNLHRKRTYGIAFSSDTFFFSPSLHRVRIKEKKKASWKFKFTLDFLRETLLTETRRTQIFSWKTGSTLAIFNKAQVDRGWLTGISFLQQQKTMIENSSLRFYILRRKRASERE